MKMLTRNIINIILLLVGFQVFSQEPSLYIRSLRSIHLENVHSVPQQINFHDVDVVYNKIGQFLNEKITLSAPGKYEISAFANINPGVMGTTSKDSIHIELFLLKNHSKSNEEILGTAQFKYSYGNFDVAAGLHIVPKVVSLQAGDDVSLWVRILPTTTIDINKSPKYDHVNKPTGMEQIAGIRIERL